MSIKPILNDADALNDKSLNLYANSIVANHIEADGDIDFKDIVCETITSTVKGDFLNLESTGLLTTLNQNSTNLITTKDLTSTNLITADDLRVSNLFEVLGGSLVIINGTSVRIGGNLIPSSSSVAGYVMENNDGTGTMAWVNPVNNTFISNGVYASGLTLVSGGANLAESFSPSYSKVGDTVTIAGNFRVDLTAVTLSVNVRLAPGTSNNSTELSSQCTGTSLSVGGGAMTIANTSVVGSLINFTCHSVNDRAIIAGNNVAVRFQYTCTYRNN